MWIIRIIVAIFVIGILLLLVIGTVREELKRDKTKISFKESLDLVDLPVCTFISNGNKINLLIDSDSDISYLCTRAKESVKIIKEDNVGLDLLTGMCSSKVNSSEISVELGYKENIFKENFIVLPELDNQFNEIKQDKGVRIDGILGNSFLSKYKYIIDYNDLSVYIK